MESLGFDEAPFDSSERVYTEADFAPTTTFSTVKGKHTKKGVEGLWDTTTIDAPSLVDWRPEDIGHLLKRRRIRRTPVILTIILVLGLSYFGYWLYRQPSEQAASAQRTVASHAAALLSSLTEAENLANQLVSGNIDDDYNTRLGAIDDVAKELFGVSATLDPTATDARSLASNASSQALADTQRIRDAAAYRLTLEPALVAPEFQTDPALINIQDATLAFGKWRSSLDEVAELLPTTVNEEITGEFVGLRRSLSQFQNEYIDALAANDGFGAARVLQTMQSELTSLRNTIANTYKQMAADIRSSIAATRSDLGELVG